MLGEETAAAASAPNEAHGGHAHQHVDGVDSAVLANVDHVLDDGQDFLFKASKEIEHVRSDAISPEAISTTLPDTGLKANLKVHPDDRIPEGDEQNGHAHGNGSANGYATPRQHERDFPDGPLGEGKPGSSVPPGGQEGAEGRGPGGHEPDYADNIVEGQGDDWDQDSRVQCFPNGEPMALSHEIESRRFKDETGQTTIAIPAVKEPAPPGPNNDIVLNPRVVHLQYHVQTNERGERGAALKVTHAGEAEITTDILDEQREQEQREQEAGPSRPMSRSESRDDLDAHGLGRAPPGGNQDENWEDLGNDRTQGHWRTAASSKAPPSAMKRPKKRQGNGYTSGSSTGGAGTPQKQASTDPQGRVRGKLNRFNPLRHGKHANRADTEVAAPNVTNEMLAGQLPVMILKTWLDRDEEGHRAVPVLLGNLRFRIGDSLTVKSGNSRGSGNGREVYKIECEYGDGAIKWIVYRELRDFIGLHAHYKKANFGAHISNFTGHMRHVTIPEFPRTALPYWAKEKVNKLDKIEDKIDETLQLGKTGEKELQQQQRYPQRQESAMSVRDSLQQYLIDLIRAVMFRPESNRLCIFFELSALTVALAPRGGFQGKAGFLTLPSAQVSRKSNQGIAPSKWKLKRSPKWFIVRESFFVAVDGPADTDIYDVFLIDNDFTIERPKRVYRKGLHLLKGSSGKHHSDDEEAGLQDEDKNASQHTFYISNAQRRIKLQARNARQMHQFIVSMERVAMQCIWAGRNRFDSFAPIRVNVAAQWLVDGRDYFWNLSRAINMAKSRIYIHDWWISPEIYLRRPGDERYRLDHLLKRKAEEGVKIFIIIYNEVSAKTTPVASHYVKAKLTGLHPNIMLQRSPSHLPNGTFYWSHHEKLCVIDETIAFMGGFDLCYGRWDTSQHIMTDESHTAPDGPNGPVWRGKDYANERLVEFGDLEKPFEDSIDRKTSPRMPWHDVGLQLVGQPARDLCRHFIQRWNYLLRIKNHTRKMPFLMPPADFTDRELVDLGLQGTCEVQICRSVGPWSMGTMSKIEHSVQNAYVKSIQLSEHFVYIENQFFITSTVVDGTPVENRIGDALVSRIIRAHKAGDAWRACIVIPLLPGYTHAVDSSEASSVRLILECQNRTICRGTRSIFSRLRKEGINPDDYISFFSLRGWAKFESGALTTEQVYIHGKTMIVDDRLVLCGSANINERSQRGDRDSELVAVIRDTDMIDGTMAGKPFKVGRYAHTLRMRLMREHVGVDVDAIEEDELMLRKPVAAADDIALWDPDNEQQNDPSRKPGARGVTHIKKSTAANRLKTTVSSAVGSIARGIGQNIKQDAAKVAEKVRGPMDSAIENIVPGPGGGPTGDPSERLDVNAEGVVREGFASSIVPTLEEKTIYERRPDERHADGQPLFGMEEEVEPPEMDDSSTAESQEVKQIPDSYRAEGQQEGSAHPAFKESSGKTPAPDTDHPQGVPEATVPTKDEKAVKERPMNEKFGTPANAPVEDDEVPGDNDEGDFPEAHEAVKARKLLRKHLSAKVGANPWNMPTPTPKIDPNRFHDPLDDRLWHDMWVAVAVHNTQIFRKVFRCVPDDLVTTWAQYKAFANHMDKFGRTEIFPNNDSSTKPTHDQGGSGGGTVGPAGSSQPESGKGDHTSGRNAATSPPSNLRNAANYAAEGTEELLSTGSTVGGSTAGGSTAGGSTAEKSGASGGGNDGGESKRSAPDDPWHSNELAEMEELLNEVRGHLVIYPTRFLEAEDMANNFLFNQERILPLLIYD